MQIVFHIDMDAFFSAIEERENPGLKDKPVVVGADPKNGKGRGVVSTANYSARKYGIRSGMPISKAYGLCPSAVYLPVNMRLYWEVSQKIMEILRKHAEKMQQTSVDEAFLVPKSVKNYQQAERTAKKIKQEIKEKEHLACSIGIGPNKLVAKIASDHNKPDGLTIVRPEEVQDFLWPLSVRKLYGVGPKTEEALKKMGIEKIGDVASQDPNRMAAVFGKIGYVMHQYASGIDNSEIIQEEGSRSVGREITFEYDTSDFDLLKKVLEDIADDIYGTAKQENYTFRTVVLKIRFTGFETHTKQKSFKQEPSKETVKKASHELLSQFKDRKKKVRLVGLRLTNLKKVVP